MRASFGQASPTGMVILVLLFLAFFAFLLLVLKLPFEKTFIVSVAIFIPCWRGVMLLGARNFRRQQIAGLRRIGDTIRAEQELSFPHVTDFQIRYGAHGWPHMDLRAAARRPQDAQEHEARIQARVTELMTVDEDFQFDLTNFDPPCKVTIVWADRSSS